MRTCRAFSYIILVLTALILFFVVQIARADNTGMFPFIRLDGSNDTSISANIEFPFGITIPRDSNPILRRMYFGTTAQDGYMRLWFGDDGFGYSAFNLLAENSATQGGTAIYWRAGGTNVVGESGGFVRFEGGGSASGAGGNGGGVEFVGGAAYGASNQAGRVLLGGGSGVSSANYGWVAIDSTYATPGRFTLTNSDTQNSLYVRKHLEVDGTTWLDGNALVGGTLNVTGATTLATSLTGILKGTSGLVAVASSSDILAAIDFGTVMLKTDAGATTFYKPSADTDAARGTALATAIAAHAAGDTIVVGPGTYELTDDFTLLAGASLIGQGRPTLYCNVLTDKPLIRLINNNITVQGIDLQTNLVGLGELSATPITVSGIVIRDVTHTPLSVTDCSGLQFSQVVGGGSAMHVVSLDAYNSKFHGGSTTGYGVHMSLNDGSEINLTNCDVYGATDGILNKNTDGTSAGVTNIFGGTYASVLDAITSGGTANVINVYGATARGDQADIYGDDGTVNVYWADARTDYIVGNGVNTTKTDNVVGNLNLLAGQLTYNAFGGGIDAGLRRIAASTLQVTNGSTTRADLEVADEAYNASTWNGSFEVPTKNAVRDQIVLMPTLAGANTWTGTNLFQNDVSIQDSPDGTGPYLNIGDNSQAAGYVSIQNDQFNTGNVLIEPQAGFGGVVYFDGGLGATIEGNFLFGTLNHLTLAEFGSTLTNPIVSAAVSSDGLSVKKQSNSAAIRGLLVQSEYHNAGGGTMANAINGLNSFAYDTSTTTANLTVSNQGGGLRNRSIVRHRGTGTVTKMSAATLLAIQDANAGTTSTAAALNLEPPSIGATTTVTNSIAANFEAGAISGTATNAYQLFVSELLHGTNRFEQWMEGAGGIFFRESTNQISSPSSGVIQYDATTRHDFTQNIQITKATPSFTLTDSGGDDYIIDVGSTASLLRIRNTTDSTNAFQVDGSGNVAVSTSYAPQSSAKFYAQDRTTSPSATARAAFTATQEVVPSGAFTGGNQRGFLGGVSFIANQNSTSGAAMIGLEGGVTVSSTAGFTQTSLNGLFGTLNFTGGSTITLSNAVSTFVSLGTGSVATTLRHIAVGSTQATGGASVGTLIGFYAPAMTLGTTANYEGWMDTDAGWFFREGGNQINSRAAATLDIDATTTLNFRVGGAIEAVLTANRLTTNNGATDTYLDWTTSGELEVGGGIFRATGTAILQDTVFTPYVSGYPLSVQSSGVNTYIEILNSAGSNTGAFFGMEGDVFAQYNWQGSAAGSGNYPIVFLGGFGSIELLRLDRTGGIVLNDTGEDVDVRIESDTDANNFFSDASTNRIGIGNASPGVKLDVTGDIRASANITSTSTGTLGWAVVDGTDNTACSSQCTNAAVFGLNLAAGATAPVMVGPSDATADICLCAGAS